MNLYKQSFCVCCRRHIVKEKGFPLIESLMFEEHDMIRRAATECMCNMVLCDEVRLLEVERNYLKVCQTEARESS